MGKCNALIKVFKNLFTKKKKIIYGIRCNEKKKKWEQAAAVSIVILVHHNKHITSCEGLVLISSLLRT